MIGINFSRFVEETLEHGGASINKNGFPPTTGYMVARKSCEQVVPVQEFTAETVKQYLMRDEVFRWVFLSEDHYLGSWVDGDKVYLDVSQNHRCSKEWAEVFAGDQQQISFYDVQNDEVIYV